MTFVDLKRQYDFVLEPRESALLLGARKTGKSTYLASRFPNSKFFDLLKTDIRLDFESVPSRFRQEVLSLSPETLALPIVVDEIQKVPALLDEVQFLIERHKLSFILCGSSARKLRRQNVNLLGGRLLLWQFFPLSWKEIPTFDLLKALKNGLIPSHYLSAKPRKAVHSYVQTYLLEEIRAEALARNLAGFSRFLEAAAMSVGNILNYANLAREAKISAKTVQEYFQILQDTLVGYLISPRAKAKSRQIITESPKFYFFDTGVLNLLKGCDLLSLKGFDAGQAFEHWILMEMKCFLSQKDVPPEIQFWKTSSGQEIDFVIEDIAVDVTISTTLSKDDLKGLTASVDQLDLKRRVVVCLEPRKRVIETSTSGVFIEVFPWQDFMEHLWQGKVF